MWYAAHLLMEFVPEAEQDPDVFRGERMFYENIILFQCENSSEAWAKAEARGRAEERDAGADLTLKWQDRPVRQRFTGVRKVVQCDLVDDQASLLEGAEATYNVIVTTDEESRRKLIAGESTDLIYD